MMMIDLPEDVCYLILIKLSMKSLLRLRCVCKLFRSMIDDPYFIKLHHSRSLACPEISTRILFYTLHGQEKENVDFFSVEIGGGGNQQAVHCATFPIDYLFSVPYPKSDNNVRFDIHCAEVNLKLFTTEHPMNRVPIFPQVVKGLVLLKDRIWNPLTGHVTSLPPAEEDLPEWHQTYSFLGFDPHANQYKVLCISSLSVCKILTIGIDGIIGSWRFIKTYKEMPILHTPVLMGCGHDMLYLSNRDYYPGCIQALDLHTEVFHTPSLPVDDNISRGWWSIYNPFPGRTLFKKMKTIWLSDGKGGWDQRLLDIPSKVLGTLGKVEILRWHRGDNDLILVGFNLKTGFLREIHIPNFQNLFFEGIIRTYVECLIRF